jgi:acyl carrier protein
MHTNIIINNKEVIQAIDEIEQKIKLLIMKNLKNLSLNQINNESELTKLGIDSIVYVKMVAAIEEEYNIEFTDMELNVKKIPNVKAFIALIKNKLNIKI